MRRAIVATLDVIAVTAMAAAVVILVTGGGEGVVAGQVVRARSVANPIGFALIAAGLARLLEPARPDAVARAAGAIRARIEAAFGPGAERLRGLMARRADALLLALLAVWLVDRGLSAPIEVEGDGVGYYAYLRSPLMDRDLDFTNEFELGPEQPWTGKKTRIGRLTNPFSIGPALIWSPFFAGGWLGTELAHAAGYDVDRTGYGGAVVTASAGATWLVGLCGIVLVYRLLLATHRRPVALVAAVAATLGSPLTFYLSFAPFYSHAHAFFAVALYLYCCVRLARGGALAWLGIGLAGGLVAITRWQDAVFWIVPAIHLATEIARARLAPRAIAAALGRGAMFLLGAAVLVAPQLAVFQVLNGDWLAVPQGKSFISIVPQHLGSVLFSWFHGLYSWTPLLALATIGLVMAARARRPWAAALLVAFLLQLWVNAGLWQWWAGHAFGARRFVSAVPLLAVGLAELYAWCAARVSARRLVVIASLACLAWTHMLAVQWLELEIPHGEMIDPAAVLARGLGDAASGEIRKIIGEETVMSTLLRHVRELVIPRLPLVSGAALLYGLAVLRSRSRAPSTG